MPRPTFARNQVSFEACPDLATHHGVQSRLRDFAAFNYVGEKREAFIRPFNLKSIICYRSEDSLQNRVGIIGIHD